MIWALWIFATYLFTICFMKSCDSPDCLIPTCYQSASSHVTEITSLTWPCAECFHKYLAQKYYHSITKYRNTNHWYGLAINFTDGLFIAICGLLWLSELFCLCCVAALKSLPTLSFNALIFPILRIVCTISFHYTCPWISSMSCTAFKITRWPIFIPRCITSAFYIPVDLY